jgi:hypothetical protein
VSVSAETIVEGTPAVGLSAAVEARVLDNGALAAVRVSVDAPVADRTFEGILESFDDDSWRVNRQRVMIDEGTTVEGRPRVGAWVEVEARTLPGGELVAVRLRVR